MRFAEFFAGIGLVRVGLEKAGWECVFANDIDPKKREMYEAMFPHDPVNHFAECDVRKLDPGTIPRIDLATASFPCTDLSLAGARAGLQGNQSSALWPFIEVLEQIRQAKPRLVLLENVTGFLTSHGGADFKSALKALNRLGYAVDAFVVDAAHFVPQSRQRLFVVGVLGSDKFVQERSLFAFADSEHRPKALSSFILNNRDIGWSIRELPPLPPRRTQLSEVLEKLHYTAPEWWSEERVTYLLNQMSPRHTFIVNELVAMSRVSVLTAFRRVRNGRSMAEIRNDGIAGCLRTPKGGSGRQIVIYVGRGSVRARLLTPRECARLMGAGDYPIAVPPNQAYFGFGDAVCVPVIQWIGDNYLNKVFGQPHTLSQRAI